MLKVLKCHSLRINMIENGFSSIEIDKYLRFKIWERMLKVKNKNFSCIMIFFLGYQ